MVNLRDAFNILSKPKIFRAAMKLNSMLWNNMKQVHILRYDIGTYLCATKIVTNWEVLF